MDDITLGSIKDILIWIVAFGGATFTIIKSIHKAIDKAFLPIEKKIDRVDKNATMNYLVRTLDDVDKNEKMEGVARKRFFEQYEHYTKDLDGNSYIKEEVDRLKKEGKL